MKHIIPSTIICVGEPTPEQSWFPGYSWTIIYCQRCLFHLGWRFTRDINRRRSDDICPLFWYVIIMKITIITII